MPELLAAMGLGKASFYNAFRSKHDVFLEVLDNYVKTVDQTLAESLSGVTQREAAIAQLLKAIVAVAREPEAKKTAWRGCLIGNTALEAGQHDPVIQARLSAGVQMLRRNFELALSLPNCNGKVLALDVRVKMSIHYVVG
jgi:TetR/AcrR family transcriptional regulator, transcriptional repressor for nem operon